MKILVYIQRMTGGGAQRALINILNHLDKNRFDIALVYGNAQTNAYMDYIHENIRVIGFTPKSNRLRHSFFLLRKIIKQEKPDLIFSTLIGSNIIVSFVNATFWKRAPLVLREANYRSSIYHASNYNKFMTWFSYNFLSEAVIAISKIIKENLVHDFHIRQKKIRLIYNLVDLKLIGRLKLEEIEEPDEDRDVKKIVAIGSLSRQKDYPTLLKAFQIVASRCKAKLLIYGEGPLEQDLRVMAAELGIASQISFRGFAQNPYQYMYNADAFVLTSVREGFPNVIAEALACGVPVVATDCNGGTREILMDGLCGRLAPMGDYEKIAEELIDVLTGDNEKMVAEGLKRVHDFDADKMVSAYEDLFMELYKKHGNRSSRSCG